MRNTLICYMKPFSLFIISLALLSLGYGKYFDTVIIDPGHGGKEPGAYWMGVREADLNLKVGLKLRAELRARGIKVIMTRMSDKTVSRATRCRLARDYPNAVFVSIHFNASLNISARGAETFAYRSEDFKLARQIQPRVHRNLKVKDRGVKAGRYDVIRLTRNPSVLVELGFMSNRNELKRCRTSWFHTTAARSIADGLMAYRKLR